MKFAAYAEQSMLDEFKKKTDPNSYSPTGSSFWFDISG